MTFNAPCNGASKNNESLTTNEQSIQITAPSYKGVNKIGYPLDAKYKHEEGTVIISANILKNGSVGDQYIAISSGYKELDSWAYNKVHGWTFNPAQERGKPIEQWANIPISFILGEAYNPDPPTSNSKENGSNILDARNGYLFGLKLGQQYPLTDERPSNQALGIDSILGAYSGSNLIVVKDTIATKPQDIEHIYVTTEPNTLRILEIGGKILIKNNEDQNIAYLAHKKLLKIKYMSTTDMYQCEDAAEINAQLLIYCGSQAIMLMKADDKKNLYIWVSTVLRRKNGAFSDHGAGIGNSTTPLKINPADY